jgi:hypothetical protein
MRISRDGHGVADDRPDGEVYWRFENPFGANHLRGWLRHFDANPTSPLSGLFRWDDTAAIVPR